MNATLPRAMLGITALSVSALFATAKAADGEDWDWMVAPYGWAASIGTDLRTGKPPLGGNSTETDFDSIIDKIDGAFQVHGEGQGDHFGMLTDFTYLGLADDKDHPRFRTETDLDSRLFELAGVWSPGPDRYHGIEVLAGLRYIDVDLTVVFDPANPIFATSSFKSGQSYADFMLGARYHWKLSDRWKLTLRGDGSFGDTDGTWNASAVVNYKMTHGAWLFGYRYLSVEVGDSDHHVDITMNGPMVGYGFTF